MSDQILESILGELKGVNQRLDGIDQRFDGIDQRLGRMDQRFDRIESTLDEVKRVGAIAVVQEQQAVAIESLRTEQLRHGKIIEALAVKSFEHDADIRELKRAR